VGRVIGLHCVGRRVLWVWWGVCGADEVPSHSIILARSVLVPFDVASEGSKVGLGEDVGVLAPNVGGVPLERLLCNCPVSHCPQ
jgi:hypothetical protein